MLKRFGIAFRATKEVKASLSKVMEGRTDEEAMEIFNDDKKLTKLAQDIYANLSEDVKTFMPFETFKDTMLKQKPRVKKDPTLGKKRKR